MNATARVLVVDDEPVVLNSCDRILSGEGIEVEGAATGHDALRRAEGNGFDLMLLDLRLNGNVQAGEAVLDQWV